MNEKTIKKPESKPVVKETTAVKAAEAKTVETKAAEVKEAAVKTEAVKTAPATKPVEANVETKTEEKTAVKEEKEAKKAAPKKKTTRKAAEKKEEKDTEVFVEFYGQQSSVADVKQKVVDQFVAEGHRASTIKSLKLYLKPEDYSAYYVINEKFAGRVDLF